MTKKRFSFSLWIDWFEQMCKRSLKRCRFVRDVVKMNHQYGQMASMNECFIYFFVLLRICLMIRVIHISFFFLDDLLIGGVQVFCVIQTLKTNLISFEDIHFSWCNYQYLVFECHEEKTSMWCKVACVRGLVFFYI